MRGTLRAVALNGLLDAPYYNFCRIHKTIRCTPAMEAGITKTVWSLEDLLTA